jgi:hypothetical protein
MILPRKERLNHSDSGLWFDLREASIRNASRHPKFSAILHSRLVPFEIALTLPTSELKAWLCFVAMLV